MRNYAGTAAASKASGNTHSALVGATTIRAQLYELSFGSVGTPADTAHEFSLARTDAATAGTPAAVSLAKLDTLDGANVAVLNTYASVYPTNYVAGDLLNFVMNRRVTWRWVAYPDCEIKIPAVAANLLGLRTITTDGSQWNVAWQWRE